MNLTEKFLLPCPSPEDYAAVAQYTERLAFAAETQILLRRALMAERQGQRVTIWANQSIKGPVTTGAATAVQLVTADVHYSSVNPPFPFNNNAHQIGLNPGSFLEPGIYHFGYSTNMAEVGAITDLSFRMIQVFVEKQVGGTAVLHAEIHRIVNGENIVGGSFFGSEGTFEVDQDFRDWRIRIEMSHANVASDMQIPINGMWAWLYRVGSSQAIEVV